MNDEQKSLFDWKAILAKPDPNWKWVQKGNHVTFIREYPYTSGFIFNGEVIERGFDALDDAKEYAAIRIYNKCTNDHIKIRIWRSNVIVWQYPPRTNNSIGL